MKNFKVLLFYPNEPMVGIVPSNLALLSACLKQIGIEVKLFDCTIYRSITGETQEDVRTKLGLVKKTDIDNYIHLKQTNIYNDFVELVNSWQPNLIAFTVVDSTIRFSLSFIEKIPRHHYIIFGGVGATFNYEKILKTGLVDFVCIGEGEEAIVELCQKMHNREYFGNVSNIYYASRSEKDKIIKTQLRPLIDLEKLPMPDFTIFEDWRFYRPFMGQIKRMLQFDFDRGCQHGCTYCAAPSLRKVFINEKCGKYYRIKSNDKFFAEMKHLIKKHNLDFIWISSETLLDLPLEQFKAFVDRYKKEINLPLWCQTRLDTFTEEKTKLLAEMGCQNVSIGLEHGSEEIRKKILNKRITNETVINAVKMMAKYNIFPTFNNMIGLPDETRKNIFETVDLNRKLSKILKGRHNLNVFTFIPFSGTKLRQICLEKGYLKEDKDLPPSFFNESVLNMPTLSKEEIKGLERTLAMYILLPKKYWPLIKKAEIYNKEGNEIFNQLMIELKKRKK